MRHLAIFDKITIGKIFTGKKTMDIRFSRKKVPPFGVINAGDTVLIKEAGGKIVGEFSATRIVTFDNLNDTQINKIKRDYNKFLQMDSLFWHEREAAKFGTLVYIDNVQPVLIPMQIIKKDRRSWIILP